MLRHKSNDYLKAAQEPWHVARQGWGGGPPAAPKVASFPLAPLSCKEFDLIYK